MPALLVAAVTAAALTACSSRLGFGGQPDVDRSLTTSSLSSAPAAPAADDERSSDIATIRNAVSSADLEAAKGAPLAWANSDTGSRGAISGLVQYSDRGELCRRFQASRESFDGVGLYKGDACLGSEGAWRMRAFDAF